MIVLLIIAVIIISGIGLCLYANLKNQYNNVLDKQKQRTDEEYVVSDNSDGYNKQKKKNKLMVVGIILIVIGVVLFLLYIALFICTGFLNFH